MDRKVPIHSVFFVHPLFNKVYFFNTFLTRFRWVDECSKMFEVSSAELRNIRYALS
jgi:hypothetical protein